MSYQKDKNDDMILAAVFAAVVLIFSFIIWHVYKTELKSGLRWLRVGEMKVAMLIHGDDKIIPAPHQSQNYSIGVWHDALKNVDPRDINFKYISSMTTVAMEGIKQIFIVFLCLFGVWAILKGPGTKYKRRMSMEGILAEHAKNFPVIAPFVKFNPGKLKARAPGDPVPPNLPIFAEALSPEEFVAFHNIPYMEKKLDRDKTFQALMAQLGPRWRGPEHLPLHAKALYAAFALKAVRKRKESDELLNEISLAWTHDGGLKIPAKLKSRINKLIRDPKVGGTLTKFTNKHGFQTTALLRALQRSRDEGGVLAPAQFLWLRGYDRALWYPLNNLGRKSYHAEAMGALTHYTYELIAGQKIPTPKFDDAISGLEEFIGGPAGRPIPKRGK